jgi:hypothetical protein
LNYSSRTRCDSNNVSVVVSDPGFEKIEREVNPSHRHQRGIKGLRLLGGMAVARDAQAYNLLRDLQTNPKYGIGRMILKDEIQRFLAFHSIRHQDDSRNVGFGSKVYPASGPRGNTSRKE